MENFIRTCGYVSISKAIILFFWAPYSFVLCSARTVTGDEACVRETDVYQGVLLSSS